MIVISCGEYFARVEGKAKELRKYDSLKKQLDYLDTYAEHGDRGKTRCTLYKDFAPLSFEFVMERRQEDGSYKYWFNGGLLFHGNHDSFGSGSAPTYAVCLENTDGWSIHT